MYGGQSSEGFLVNHDLLLSKRRNDSAFFNAKGTAPHMTEAEYFKDYFRLTAMKTVERVTGGSRVFLGEWALLR